MKRQIRVLLLLVALGCASAHPAAVETWQSDSGYLALEQNRLVWFDPARNDLSVGTVLQRNGELVTRHRGRIERVQLTRQGEMLVVTAGGKSETYRRAAQLPEAMQLTPLPLGEATPLPQETVDGIKAELEKRNAEDQRLLKAKAPAEEIRAVQQANDAYLRDVAARYGWIDIGRFGIKAAGAALIMAKHSADTRLLLAALPTIESDLAKDPGFAQAFAVAYDQLLLSLGQRQRFGSQVCSTSGTNPFLCAVETPSRIDERRTAIGLPPLGEYLELVSRMLYKNEPVRIPKDEELQ